MSQSVINNAGVLRFLQKAKPQYRRAILKAADKTLVHCICECVHNTLKGTVPLTQSQRKRLAQHKKILRRLVKRGESVSLKKKIINQRGGAFLPMILAPLITGVLGSLFK